MAYIIYHVTANTQFVLSFISSFTLTQSNGMYYFFQVLTILGSKTRYRILIEFAGIIYATS
jgi:hypothetical protein